MRKLVIAAWAVLCSVLIAVPAAADSPATLPPLAPGEVLLEVSAYGVARSPATSAIFTAQIRANAASEEEARRNVTSAVAQITTAARAAGATAADIVAGPVSSDRSFVDLYNTIDVDMNSAASTDEARVAHYAHSTVTITLRNPAAAPALRGTLSAIDGVDVERVQYRLDDDRAARRTARGEAIRNARTDAETYAAAMNMRIVRVLRVTERTGFDSLPMALTEDNALARGMRDGPGGIIGQNRESGEIETYAVLGVDYALAPLR